MATLAQHLLQFLFPIKCVTCGADLPADDYYRICPKCQLDIKIIGKFHCNICGSYMPDGGEHCYHCLKKTNYHFEYLRSSGLYSGVLRGLIHKFKYKNRDYLSRFLSRLLVKTIETNINMEEIDYIIPVPMHWLKKIKRGYNQTEILSQDIGKHFNKPVMLNNLIRIKLARPQIYLKREERLSNVKKCFKIKKPHFINNKNIILIDDVCTTCATIEECSIELKRSGANKIYAVTVARD